MAELDPVRRMRVLAAASPGVAYAEKLIPAPFSAVWEAASDLERELPCMVTDLRSFEITSTRGERLTARARGRLGQRARFNVVLRPGWCVMQSRFLIGGMAAIPEAGGTRFAFLGGLRLPGVRLLDPVLRPAAQPLALRPISGWSTGSGPADGTVPGAQDPDEPVSFPRRRVACRRVGVVMVSGSLRPGRGPGVRPWRPMRPPRGGVRGRGGRGRVRRLPRGRRSSRW